MSRSDDTPRARSLPFRLSRLVVNLVLLAVTVGAAAYLVPTVLGYERYVITGGSMAGTIEKGSLVFERPVPVGDLVEGDIITYLPPAESGVATLVTHRIKHIGTAPSGRPLYRTQGDANPDPDPWRFSLTAATQPVAEFSVPYVGYAFIALADRETRMLVVGVPAVLVGLLSLVELVSAVRPRRRGPMLPRPTFT